MQADAADPAREGVANAFAAADGADPSAQALIRAVQEFFVDGWQQAMWAGVAVMTVLFVYVLLRGPQRTPPGAPTIVTAPVSDEVARRCLPT